MRHKTAHEELINAITRFEEQDKRELDFCYDGGAQDAVKCAIAFYPYAKESLNITADEKQKSFNRLTNFLVECHDPEFCPTLIYSADEIGELQNDLIILKCSIDKETK